MQIAGLDVGWGQRLDLHRSPQSQRFQVERELPVGRFPYKFLCAPACLLVTVLL